MPPSHITPSHHLLHHPFTTSTHTRTPPYLEEGVRPDEQDGGADGVDDRQQHQHVCEGRQDLARARARARPRT